MVPPAVDAVLPPRSPSSFWKAELRFDSALDDRPLEGSVSLSSWLLPRSLTRVCSAAMMPLCPYAATPAVAEAVVLTGAVLEGVVPSIEAAGAPVSAVVAAAAVPLLAGAEVVVALTPDAEGAVALPLAGVAVDVALPGVADSDGSPPPPLWADRPASRSA